MCELHCSSNTHSTVSVFLNSLACKKFLRSVVLSSEPVQQRAAASNFWLGGTFLLIDVKLVSLDESMLLKAQFTEGRRVWTDFITVPYSSRYPSVEEGEKLLAATLASTYSYVEIAGQILALPTGIDLRLPQNMKLNNVPHYQWVRRYFHDSATKAVLEAITCKTTVNKSRLQLRVNYPEMNPSFDTYRMASVLELVRAIALELVGQFPPLRVRICVQRSMGEGVFAGLPISLASMLQMMEQMDWGRQLKEYEKVQPTDEWMPREEALLRFGGVGAEFVADDDDVFLVVCPQNSGSIVPLLEAMVEKANGRSLILLNPQLTDVPSANNVMQVRGRAERRAFADSFQDVYAFLLQYPVGAGRMYPITGALVKQSLALPWVVYEKVDANGQESYDVVAAFPPDQPPSDVGVAKALS